MSGVTATPAAPSLAFGEDTGASDSDGLTNLSGPLLIGQTVPNAVITLYDNLFATTVDDSALSGPAATVVADANGNYAFYPFPVLDDGKHTLTITVTAPGMTPSQFSPPLYLVVDTSPPDPPTAPVLAAGFDTGASAEDGITSEQTLQLTGTAEPGSMVRLYNNVDADGDAANGDEVKTLLGQATAGADGAYTITTDALPDGAYKLTVTATDLAGNVGTPSAETAITIDSAAPAAPAAPTLSPGTDTGVLHNDGLTDNNTPVVTGTAEANATVEIFDGVKMAGKGTADGSGNYAITLGALADGSYGLTAKAVDAAGNISDASAPLNIVVDTVAPTAVITPLDTIEESGNVTFTVKFSEIVTGVAAADFKLVTTGNAFGALQSVAGSGTDYTVTVNGLGGEGTVRLALANSQITDLAGNAASLAESDFHAVSGTTALSTTLVSTSATGVGGTGDQGSPSASGRAVAFNSISALTPDADAGTNNIFVKDIQTGAITLITTGNDAETSDGDSFGASLSANGTELAFASTATNFFNDGPTTAGETNVYVVKLTEGANGPQIVPGTLELVSDGNGQQGEGFNDDGSQAMDAPILSADGSTVVFDSTLSLVKGAESGVENVYAENIATGDVTLVSKGTGQNEYAYVQAFDPIAGIYYLQLAAQPNGQAGVGGDFDSDVTSVSANGQLIAYESEATDLGGPALTPGSVAPVTLGYVYNTVTGATTVINGITNFVPGSADIADDGFQTYDPVLSGDGTKVYYSLHYVANAATASQEEFQYVFATNKTTNVSVFPDANDVEFDTNTSDTTGGGLGLYDNFLDGSQIYLANPASNTVTAVGAGTSPVLSESGNAFTFSLENGAGDDQLYETNFNVSAGIAAIGNDDTLNARELLAAANAGGLTLSGTTNAPAGAAVAVQFFGASAATSGNNSVVYFGTADGAGHWSATVPVTFLQTADGPYALEVQIGTAIGNSFISTRDFMVDTQAPATPDAPKLDAGADTSMAGDGSATNQDMPVLTGTAEAGATVTLYDISSASPATPIGTATADAQGVYVITPVIALINGKHTLDVTAADAAGNVSDASAGDTFTVDTIAPAQPKAPMLQPAPEGTGDFEGSSLIDDPSATAVVSSDTGISDTDDITSNATPNITGMAEPGTTVTLYDTDGIAVLGTAKVDAAGNYIIASNSLSDGVHKLTVTDTDAAGNVSLPSTALSVTIDTLPPLQPTISSVTGPLVSGKITELVTVNGTAEPGALVQLVLDGGMGPNFIFGQSTAASDGDFSINSDPLPAGDGQNLSVVATDIAGNMGQASLPVDVNITDSATPPPGVPPFTPTLLGLLTDGPISGATVFADTNGNGMLDADEGSALTTTTGQFSLVNTGGELIATGGVDTETGLALPGALTAPANSSVIDPLTTLLDAYAAAAGETPAAAQPALLSILGLDPTADLTRIDPVTAAAGGDFSFLIASAKVMDSAVVFADLAAAQTGVSSAAAFAASFAAMARQAATGTLNLEDGATTLAALASSTVAIAAPGAVLPDALAQDASGILYYGNRYLDPAAQPIDGSTPLAFISAEEFVEQGEAAPQFAAASTSADPDDAGNVAMQYYYDPGQFSGLSDAVTAAETIVLAAPVLAAAGDTGASAHDNLTSQSLVTFTGTAPPGAPVFLVSEISNVPGTGTILGTGTADAAGAYSITVMLGGGRDNVLAFQAAPGETVTIGATINLPRVLSPTQVTEVTVGDLPETSPPVAPPTFRNVIYADASGNDATHAALYVTGFGSYDIQEGSVFTLTADGNPVSVGVAQSIAGDFGILTTPLANGTHSLVVTETALDGETVQSLPFTVTVTAPGSFAVMAEATGPVVGGSIIPYDYQQPLPTYEADTQHPNADTDASGMADVPNQAFVPDQEGGFSNATDAGGLELLGGQDALTGLPVPIDLSAPPGADVIDPATSLINQADYDAESQEAEPNAQDIAFENGRIDNMLGLPATVDLLTADPLAMAEAGDPSVLLKNIELLDTLVLLKPFVASPLHTIDLSQGIYPFDGLFLSGHAPTLTAGPIDFTSAAQVLQWLTTYNSVIVRGNLDTSYDASVLPVAAAIIAASNAAIETHAAASTNLADTLSYALAVERVALGTEAQALAVPALPANTAVTDDEITQQQAEFAALQTAYTGAGLDAAVAAALAQTVQVTSFSPDSAGTGAPSETFTITFSVPVTGVTAGNFSVTASAGLVGAAVSAVTPIAGGDGAAYTVTVNTGVGDGTLSLGFTPNAITNAQGKPLTSGLFATRESYSSPTPFSNQGTRDLAVGDFNNDGRPDVAATVDGAFTLFIGQGDGSFVAKPAIYTGPATATRVVTGDFNGDGNLDAVTLGGSVSYQGDQTVSALLGNGDGTFGNPIQTDVGPAATNIVAGDFNGDGKLDLAVLYEPNDYTDATVQLYYGNGDGSFDAGPGFDTGSNAGVNTTFPSDDQMVEADVNGDGNADLVISTVAPNTGIAGVSVFLGNGHGGFTMAAPPVLNLGSTSDVIAVGDLNGDGIPDIVAVPFIDTSNTIDVLLGRGDGTFQPAVSVALPLAASDDSSFNNINVAIGDITGDGKPDIVVNNAAYGDIVLPGNGDGTFGQAYLTDAQTGEATEGLALADINGDGRLDVVSAGISSAIGNSVGPGISVALNTAQTVLPASAAITVDRPAVAQPVFMQTGGGGSLTHTGNAYTLNLGTLTQGEAASAIVALMNAASAPADSFDGLFSTPAGTGFTVTGDTLDGAVAAGASAAALNFAADTGTPGEHTETITFAPRDASAVAAPAASLDASGDTGVTNAASNADAVARELPALTLTVTDDVTANTGPAPAQLGVSSTMITLPNARLGAADQQAIAITNSAAAGSADLDVTATAAGNATVSGSVSGLAPQASDTTSLVAGLDTGTAGARGGTVTVMPVSAPDTPLAAVAIALSGDVYREATASAAAVSTVLHVGDPGAVTLAVTNTDPADGFSEALDASISGVTGGLSSSGTAAVIAAGATGTSLAVEISTAAAGTITGTATLALASDGGTGAGSLDGLGQLTLASAVVPVSVTLDNYAVASLLELSGGGTWHQTGNDYTLDLGTIDQGASAPVIDIAALNAATGPADTLSGSFQLAGPGNYTTTGFGALSGLDAGIAADAGMVTLSTANTGSFSETITFDPAGSNSSGYSAALAAETLTINGVVQANQQTMLPAIAVIDTASPVAFGNVHLGATVSRTIGISNTAATPAQAATLDAAAGARSGDATASGTIRTLAAGATDATDISVGIATGTAGPQTGAVTLDFLSDDGSGGTAALPSQTVAVSGRVYREAVAAIAPVDETVHVGDPGTALLSVRNTDPDDGNSENLIASLTGVSGVTGVTAGTGEIAAGASATLGVGFSTASAGVITGTAMLGLVSDGGTGAGSLDGLGRTALASMNVPVSITVDNLAVASLANQGGTLVRGSAPGTWTLNLGTVEQGSAALSASLNVLNSAGGPADLLGGAFTVASSAGFSNSGFGDFGGLAAGGQTAAGSVSLATAQPGTFSETILLTPTDTEGKGTPTAQTPQTVTVTGTVTPQTGTAQGDVHIVTFDGLHYDFQATGDFVLARATNPDNSFQIQIRASEYQQNPGTSITTELAARVGRDVVSFNVTGAAVTINGIADTAINTPGTAQQLDGGTLAAVSSTSYALTWDTGEKLYVTNFGFFLNESAVLSPRDGPGAVQGLLGSDSGQQNDFQLPDGSVLTQPVPAATLLGRFADAWRVAPAASLLNTGLLSDPVQAGRIEQSAFGLMPFLSPAANDQILATQTGEILTGSAVAGTLTQGVLPGVTFHGALASLSSDIITNFGSNDLIDITDFNGGGAASLKFNKISDTLHIGYGGRSADISFAGTISRTFWAASDGHGGTVIGS